MIALVYVAFLAGIVGGYVLRALMERANRESEPAAEIITQDFRFKLPLSVEQKRAVVADLVEYQQRRKVGL